MPTTNPQVLITVTPAQLAWLTANIGAGQRGAAFRDALRVVFPDFPNDMPAQGAALANNPEAARRTRRGQPKAE